MASGRTKPPGGSGPRGGKRRPTARPAVRPGQRPGGVRPRAATAALLPRPRFTGRAAVLVLVLSVLMVSYASSFRAYLEQRQHLSDLHDRITRSNANILDLRREKQRWADPAFRQQMARDKFNFVMPGEVSLVVLDHNGQPLGHVDSLSDPAVATDGGKPQWYQTAWDSVLLAGNPPDPAEEPQPASVIKPPKQPKNDD